MNAQQLAQRLINQATPANRIYLNDTVLGRTGFEALVKEYLRRDDGTVYMTVAPSAIPTDPPPAGFMITAASVPAGSDAFLALDSRDATIQFVVGATIDVVLTVHTKLEDSKPVNWTLGRSFPEVAYLAYDDLTFDDPTLVFATNAEEPLSFDGGLELTGIFATAASLVGASGTYPLAGALQGAGKDFGFDLQASLSISGKPIVGMVTLDGVGVGVSLTSIERDQVVDRLVALYLYATVGIKGADNQQHTLTTRASMPLDGDAPTTAMLSLVPGKDGLIASLGDLGHMVAGESWDDFFSGPASVIKGFFDDFGLKSYSLSVGLMPPAPQSMSLVVGTGQDWQFWPDHPEYKLGLNGAWTLVFLGQTTSSYLIVTADFTFGGFEFELSIDSNLVIAGRQKGEPVTLSLSQLSQKAFGGGLQVPVNLDLSVSDFSFSIDVNGKAFGFGLTATADFGLFGTRILALKDFKANVTIDMSKTPTTYLAQLDGQVVLGPIALQADATITNKPDVHTVFTLHLVGETVGSMLGHVVHLVDPTYDLSFGDPWDKLLAISLDAFVLEVDVTAGSVSIAYTHTLDLGFVTITKLALTYAKGTPPASASSTRVEISGSFLGIDFGTNGRPALGWDPVNESPPAPPGKGSSLFDLRYAGLGQHVAFGGDQPATMKDVMTRLQSSMVPTEPGKTPVLGGKDGLVFSADSNWLIGADFTVADTVSITAIFNDPKLYGVLIGLSGEKAKIFAGLSFEILYRKVTDTIGVYHIELKLPDAMRNLQFGEVSVTLPIVVLDVYTNGNFRVDFGFPQGLDFSRSFSVQVFPFVGYGGFYFALLNGSTSSRVPQITNGTWSPVIEFGLALSIGVGKTVDEGILKGGISVTVVGILQGVLAWFHPTDTSPRETYYWFQGTVAVVGRLYAEIDFAIIQASLDVTAYLSVTLTIESHQPIYIEATARVSVRVSVKIVFFTIHLSFSATVNASFTIGQATPTPWKLASGNGASSNGPARAMRGQRTLHSALAMHHGYRRALRRATVAAGDPITKWPADCVLPGGKQAIGLVALPAFTMAESGGPAAVVLLGAPNSIHPSAATHAEHLRLHGAAPQTAPFNLLMEAMLRWGILALTGGSTTVSADQLEALRKQLQDPDTVTAAFGYGTLTAFLAANFSIDVEAATDDNGTGVALFPMIPAIELTDKDGTGVDFGTFNEVDADYVASVRRYFQSLQVQFEAARGPDGKGGEGALGVASGPSMAMVVFCQYFNLLMSSGVKAATDFLAAYPCHTGSAAMSVAEVATAVGDPSLGGDPLRVVAPNQNKAVLQEGAVLDLAHVVQQAASGDTLTKVAATLAALGAKDEGGSTYSAQDLVAANLDASGLYTTGTSVTFTGLAYTTVDGDTLDLIGARLLVRAAGATLLNSLTGLGQAVDALVALNGGIDPNGPIAAKTVWVSQTVQYTVVPGDTLTLIAAYALAAVQGAVDVPTFVTALLALPTNSGLPVKDPTRAQSPGTVVAMPPVVRSLAPGDTIDGLAVTLLAQGTDPIAAGLVDVELAPQAVLHAPLSYPVAAGDTFAKVAARFDLTLADVAAAAAPATGLFAPDKDIVVSDVESAGVDALVGGLLGDAVTNQDSEWNRASAMVSRFMLSGLRLPNPGDGALAAAAFADVGTSPMYVLTGQQYAAPSSPSDYTITLANQAGASWLTLGGSSSVTFGLSAGQQALLADMATPVEPDTDAPARLALYQMVPPRIALPQHVAWQAAARPTGCLGDVTAAGNPSIWPFPDALITELAGGGAQLYEVVTARHHDPAQPVTADQVGCSAWATIVDFEISAPQADGPSPAIANAFVVEGSDDTGAALLQALYAALPDTGGAQIFLLRSPDPTSANPSGLASDVLDPAATCLIKTNLSTLTHSGGLQLEALAASDPTDVYAASLSSPRDFVALLWEASITRSGGFYLDYAGAPLSLGTSSSAQLSLLVILDAQAASPDAPVLPLHNCVVIGDNVDTTTTSVFAQPVTYTVQAGDSLTSVAGWFSKNWGTTVDAAAVAALNQDVPLLLAVGAQLANPAGGETTVQYGDTLAGMAARLGTSVADLVAAGANATDPILAPGAAMQFGAGVLRPATTVPPGTAGFEITRVNPDPQNLPWDQLTAQQIVDSLFNMVGWSITAGGAFSASGMGLPTTPTDALRLQPDGLTAKAPDEDDTNWYYTQALAVSPFGSPQHGSVSAALPPAKDNPYNGVGVDGGGALNEVAIALQLQDVYGNAQPMPSGQAELEVPVGYYDDVAGLGTWPSLALSYVVAGPPAAVQLVPAFQQTSYVPSPTVPVDAALSSVAADLKRYREIYYQLVQPDLAFSLETSLALDGSAPVSYALPKQPFLAFASGAFVQLAAFSTLQALELDVGGRTLSVADVTSLYGVSAPELFGANQNALYSTVFGTTTLRVPVMYSTVEADTLDSIVANPEWANKGVSPTVDQLATFNADVPLGPGADLAVPSRQVQAASSGTLDDTATAAGASVAALGAANADPGTDILVAGTVLALGTATYKLGASDTLKNAATQLGGTVEQVAVANQHVPAVLIPGVAMTVADRLVVAGDTLASIGGSNVVALAEANASVPNLFAPATQVQVGWSAKPVAPEQTDTITTYATANQVTVDQLASANDTTAAVLAPTAKLQIPGALQPTGRPAFCTYSARGTDTVGGIATDFEVDPAQIVALNLDIPGLLAGGRPVADSASGKSVTTQTGDSFETIIQRFASIGVTVSPDALAADVAGVQQLVVTGGLWLCAPMRAGAGGANAQRSLSGLTTAYNVDPIAFATANAATIGLLASGVALSGWSLTTTAFETLNSLANRTGLSVEAVAAAVATVPNLLATDATIMPVPPPASPVAVEIEAKLGTAIAPVATAVTMTRDGKLVDPDFADSPTVLSSAFTVPPETSGDTLTLDDFAAGIETAIPGVKAAMGDPIAEGDPATVSVVNFTSTIGPQLGYAFDAAKTEYFALPPLSRALMGRKVDVPTYVTGQDPPFSEPSKTQTFQAVDLDVWLDQFLAAVDLFLSPAYAVPAHALVPEAVTGVVANKKALAQALSARVKHVLSGSGGSLEDAKGAMYQALLGQLSSAFTVTTLVQVPVDVSSGGTDPRSAPRLSGKVVMANGGSGDVPSAFSFSTAKVSLTQPSSTSTFMFSVKSPAEQRSAALDLEFVVDQLEVPDPGTVIGDYEGSSWLKFLSPVNPAWSAMPGLVIPIPLRAYPSPVTLVEQDAKQSVDAPASAADLLPWDLRFVYQHDDATQDTPLVEVTFNPNGASASSAAVLGEDPRLPAIFDALAKFSAVWPALKNDLATLPLTAPGTSSPTATAAAAAFAQLVAWVAEAFVVTPLGVPYEPVPKTFYYQLQKEQTADLSPTLTRLVVSSIDPATGAPRANPVALWPAVTATYVGVAYALQPDGSPTATQAAYTYPAGMIPAAAAVEQQFEFEWGVEVPSPSVGAARAGGADSAAAPQTFRFRDVNVLAEQTARAGVSIWRNVSLIDGVTTNAAFVYQTPITQFSSNAVPSVSASDPLPITGTGVAEALGTFLHELLVVPGGWSPGETLSIRLGGGYSYAIAAGLYVLVPIFLIPAADFDPTTDWQVSAGTFVTGVQDTVTTWQHDNAPLSTANASIRFDLTVYSSTGALQSLIHASALAYALSSS